MNKLYYVANITIIITFLLSIKILAGGSKIEGYVQDAQTGKALPGAYIVIKGTGFGAVTNTNGRYAIENVPAGSYVIKVTFIGYRTGEYSIKIIEGINVERNFKLEAVSLRGKTVVVTAQAGGQNAAINQQLSSSQIENVVSSARIRELPDENAAESVGRLPGVSLIRSGGEGAQVVIRGLAPKYNLITIDGVQIPSNVSGSNAVDLSMISSSMLDGIQVIKAVTPDMDASALGGTVNFQLREAANTNLSNAFNLTAQGGYNGLLNTYSNYKFVGSSEARYFNSKLGIFGEVSAERRDLTSNVLGASFSLNGPVLGKVNPTYLDVLALTDVPRIVQRYGGTITMDYKSSDLEIGLMNLFSLSNTNAQYRGESYSLISNLHNMATTDEQNKLDIITNILDIKKNFQYFTVDAKLAHSYSENIIPNGEVFSFTQSSVGLSHVSYQRLNPQEIPPLASIDLSKTFLQTWDKFNSFNRNRHLSASLDFQSQFNFSQEITSKFKFGGMFKYSINSYDYNIGDGSMVYSSYPIIQALINAFPWMAKTISNSNSLIPYTLLEMSNFNYGKFLGGNYHMYPATNIGLMHQMISIISQPQNVTEQSFPYDSFLSTTSDYSGKEYESAAYIMATTNFGQDISLITGARFQQLVTAYTAPRGYQTSEAGISYSYHDTTIDETHGYWLPMALLKYKLLPWLQLHLAYTNTLHYPSYTSIVPKINIGLSGNIAWNNFALKPARSENYDVAVALYSNNIGLFTVDGFLKHISNLIFPFTEYVVNPSNYPGIPGNTVGDLIATFENNPNPVDLWGVELDWQTHFWYLPSVLSGLILDINYTHIFSKAKYPLTTVSTVYYPKFQKTIDYSFYTDRMVYQPDNIVNLSIGYDYKGFSSRVSMILQSKVFQGTNFWPELRVNTARYVRWDISVKQELGLFGIQAFFDISNLNNESDLSLNQGSNFPVSEQYYGLKADLGFQKNF